VVCIWVDRIARSAILFLILFTPLVFGAVHPWAFALLEAAIFLLVALWMIQLIAVRRGALGVSRASFPLRTTAFALPLVLFIAFVVFQIVPLPAVLLQVLSPATYELYAKSLPGWPAKIPYNDLDHWKQGSVQPDDRRWMILPTPQEIEKGAPIPFAPGAASTELGAGRREQSAKSEEDAKDRSPTSEVRDQRPEARDQESLLRSESTSRVLTSDFPRLVPQTWMPLSLAPTLSQTDLLKFAAYSAFFFVLLLYPSTGVPSFGWGRQTAAGEMHFIRTVLAAVFVTGIVVAVIGIPQTLTWNGKVLWFFEAYDRTLPGPGAIARSSGPFVNPSHFANYLTMIFFLFSAGAFWPASLFSRQAAPAVRVACGVGGLILFLAILLSLSRGAWIAFVCGSAVFISCFFRIAARKETDNIAPGCRSYRLPLLTGAGIFLLFSLFLLGPQGMHQLGARLEETAAQETGLRGRVLLWRDTLRMVLDFPLFGVGLGVWPDLFPRYRSAPWSAVFFREAHNDYLEVLAETGLLGLGLLSVFFWQCGRVLIAQLPAISPTVFPVYVAVLSALAAMAVHEVFDFSLQIPANAVLFTVLLAVAVRLALNAQGARDVQHGSELRSTLHAPCAMLLGVCALCVLLICAALRQEMTPYPYNLREPVSVTEARDMILAHPARAAGHYYMFQRAQLEAPRPWLAKELETAVWLAPTNPYARDLHAALLLQERRRQEGLEEISRSVFYSPSFQTHVYLNPGFIQWLLADELSAIEHGFQQAIARGFRDAFGHLVAFYESLRRYVDAAKLYETAAVKTKDSKERSILLLKAGYFYAIGDVEKKADALLRQRIAANPSDPLAYQYLATLVYVPNRNFAAARAIVAEGIRNGADPGALYASLADAAAKIGDHSEEKSALVEAVKLMPSSHTLHYRLGILALREENFDRAALYLGQAAKLNPQLIEAIFHLAVAEEGRYRFGAADKAYLRALELAPQQTHYRERYEAFRRKLSDNQKSGLALSN
jgi:O-antigen ligase/tetratricopeptide (TPR) repeat protein